MNNLITIFIAAAFVKNFVFYRFLGICPFLGISRHIKSAVSMGASVTFVMIISGVSTWLIQNLILDGFGLPFLKYPAFILVIASLVQLIEMFLKRYHQDIYKTFGIYLPLITTNCAILGLALLNSILGYNFIESFIYSIGAGFGFTLALVIMAGIRERLEIAPVPKPFENIPIALIIAGLLAMAFSGFTSLGLG